MVEPSLEIRELPIFILDDVREALVPILFAQFRDVARDHKVEVVEKAMAGYRLCPRRLYSLRDRHRGSDQSEHRFEEARAVHGRENSEHRQHFVASPPMIDSKSILKQLAARYGGHFSETWNNEVGPGKPSYSAQIEGPGFSFQIESDLQKGEPIEHLQERTKDQLVWFIMQQGVENVIEKGEIFKMFNPGAENG